MAATIDQVIDRFAAEAPDGKLLMQQSAAVTVRYRDRAELRGSFGQSLGRIMPKGMKHRSWWLLNGDIQRRDSGATSRHQRRLRESCEKTQLPVLIVPFSCLDSAGIITESIVPVDIQPERTEIRYCTGEVAMPALERPEYIARAAQNPDGTWDYEIHRHWLGASLFRASYRTGTRWDRSSRKSSAYFLSSFDAQEPAQLYFLAQLPAGVKPSTVEEAVEALKPPEVVQAEADGREVVRQGDVFGIRTDLTTRQLHSTGTYMDRRISRVLGVNHTATDVIEMVRDGRPFDARLVHSETYARGILRHDPVGRRPEHVKRPLGDRKSWYRLVLNTVPVGRSWAIQGYVD
jgi:hypothetical protein